MLVIDAKVKRQWMLVTKMTKTVTSIRPQHISFVTNIVVIAFLKICLFGMVIPSHTSVCI